jgi:hypothetical protein
MNKINMHDELKIVNNRVSNMLNSNSVNSEMFFRDVRTLTELVLEHQFNEREHGEGL